MRLAPNANGCGTLEDRRSAEGAGLDLARRPACINDLGTEWAFEDVIEVVGGAHQHLDLIMIPKVHQGQRRALHRHAALAAREKLKTDRRIGIEVLIEESQAMMNVERSHARRPGASRR